MAEFKKVKTAIVGCGMISYIYAKNLTNLFSIIDLVAVCDVIPEAAKKRQEQFNVPKIMTMDEICADTEIELVVNLTAPAVHYEVIKKLLEAGKNVYTEKVICFDVEQGKELVKLADEKGLYLGVAPDTFLGAGLQTARNILDCGLIGDVTSVVACINRNQPRNSEHFGYIRFEGGAFPYDVGVYYVQALNALFGPVKRIAGFAQNAPTHQGEFIFRGNYGKEWDMVGTQLHTASLQFENGVLGSIHFNGISIGNEEPHIAIYGSKGILYLGDANRFDTEVSLKIQGSDPVKFPFTHGFPGYPLYGEADPLWDWGGHRGIGPAELAWSMRLGRKPRAGKELGLHTLEVLVGIDKASAENKVYEMTTTFEKPAMLPSGYFCTCGGMRTDAEMAFTL